MKRIIAETIDELDSKLALELITQASEDMTQSKATTVQITRNYVCFSGSDVMTFVSGVRARERTERCAGCDRRSVLL